MIWQPVDKGKSPTQGGSYPAGATHFFSGLLEFLGEAQRVRTLCFSIRDSASHDQVDRVTEALKIAKYLLTPRSLYFPLAHFVCPAPT